MSDKLRHTLTALLFLAVLVAGIAYLGIGLNEQRFVQGEGFAHVEKPFLLSQRQHRGKDAPDRRTKGEFVTPADLAARADKATGAVETLLTDTLDQDHLFIESYGLVQQAIGRRVMEDMDPQYTVARLSDGTLTFANPNATYQSPQGYAQSFAALGEALKTRFRIPLLYVQAPQKVYYDGEATLPDGLEDYGDTHANAFLHAVRALGVDTLDLRPLFTGEPEEEPELPIFPKDEVYDLREDTEAPSEEEESENEVEITSEETSEEKTETNTDEDTDENEEEEKEEEPEISPYEYPLFFETDHHWTAHGAFLGWQSLAEKLETDYGFTVDPDFTDLREWKCKLYADIFLGSQGKRVGSLYAGLDDFYTLYPKKFTRFEYSVPSQGIARRGRFQSSLLFSERLKEGDLYETNPYTYYSGGDYPFARMKNLLNPDGPVVVLLRDSFACPFAPYLALACSELVTIDLRYFNDDLLNYISWVEADMVIALYSPGALRNDVFFDFFSVPYTGRPVNRKPLTNVLTVEKPVPGVYGDEHAQGDHPSEEPETVVFPRDENAPDLKGLTPSRHFQIHTLEKRADLD